MDQYFFGVFKKNYLEVTSTVAVQYFINEGVW